MGGVHHIDRGYVHLAEKLNGLGADIYRISVDEPKLEATKAPSEKVEKEVPMFKVQPTLA